MGRSGSQSLKKKNVTRECQWSCLEPRMQPSFPTPSSRPVASARNCPTGSRISTASRNVSPLFRSINKRSSVTFHPSVALSAKELLHERKRNTYQFRPCRRHCCHGAPEDVVSG